MSGRLPNQRYIGDGVYASHDGLNLILETSNGLTVQDRIALDGNTLDGMQKYIEYSREFYQSGQHLVPPGCEDCGTDVRNPASPLAGALSAEIYQVRYNDASHEVRLCQACAKTVDEPFLRSLIDKRARPDQAL